MVGVGGEEQWIATSRPVPCSEIHWLFWQGIACSIIFGNQTFKGVYTSCVTQFISSELDVLNLEASLEIKNDIVPFMCD